RAQRVARTLPHVRRADYPAICSLHDPRDPMSQPPFFFQVLPQPPSSTLFPYTTLFRSITPAATPSCPSTKANSPICARPIPARIDRKRHTSELQSRGHLVCRLLLEKKKTRIMGAEQSFSPGPGVSRQSCRPDTPQQHSG